MKTIGLYFGSFNPPHIGHMIIANYMLEFSKMEELWFVVSPQSPMKDKKSLIDGRTRLEMTRLSIEKHSRMRVSDVEFYLPKPNYTIHTLTVLGEKYPEYQFGLIMGMDNLQNLHKWKNWEVIRDQYPIWVYPRPGIDGDVNKSLQNVQIIDAPLMEISSSMIRKSIADGKDVRFFLRPEVMEMIDREGLYR